VVGTAPFREFRVYNAARAAFRAIAAVDDQLAKQLRKDEILYSFAEFRFPEFRDDRTPDAEVLERVLTVVHAENAAGRLVFDDLGALFWRLTTTFPAGDTAYRRRYLVVIADEHQDFRNCRTRSFVGSARHS
jgi:hypothetical protein